MKPLRLVLEGYSPGKWKLLNECVSIDRAEGMAMIRIELESGNMRFSVQERFLFKELEGFSHMLIGLREQKVNCCILESKMGNCRLTFGWRGGPAGFETGFKLYAELQFIGFFPMELELIGVGIRPRTRFQCIGLNCGDNIEAIVEYYSNIFAACPSEDAQ